MVRSGDTPEDQIHFNDFIEQHHGLQFDKPLGLPCTLAPQIGQ